jgi:hypothetical protein
MSGYADERQAIEARMASGFTTIPCRYENAPFREMVTAYCALFIRTGEGNQVTLGSTPQLHRWTGLIIVQIFVPEDTGTQAARGYADAIADVFRRQEFSAGASGLIRCRTPRIEPAGTRDGWYQLNVVTPYIRDKTV